MNSPISGHCHLCLAWLFLFSTATLLAQDPSSPQAAALQTWSDRSDPAAATAFLQEGDSLKIQTTRKDGDNGFEEFRGGVACEYGKNASDAVQNFEVSFSIRVEKAKNLSALAIRETAGGWAIVGAEYGGEDEWRWGFSSGKGIDEKGLPRAPVVSPVAVEEGESYAFVITVDRAGKRYRAKVNRLAMPGAGETGESSFETEWLALETSAENAARGLELIARISANDGDPDREGVGIFDLRALKIRSH